MRGPLLIGLALVCTLVVAGTLVAVSDHRSAPAVEAAERVDAADESEEAQASHSPEYTVFSDDHVTLRYPLGWELEDVTDYYADVVIKYLITAPDGEHQICLYVADLEEDPAFSAREHHKTAETDLATDSRVSQWRRTELREGASGPDGASTSELEATYTSTVWDRPDRWMRWQLALDGEGVTTSLQFMVPAANRTEYEHVADEVFASFRLVP
ncbi:hypothetical protein [Nocardiopsis sp. Huas11]|uniref:hypothetical protein n=1 Tax=Nocardiopsis sp. Huas11 TaxID=2183912 RepID=UPI000EAC234A|nr:hypothetical protein [Nocardiopsis sp. Huas11]